MIDYAKLREPFAPEDVEWMIASTNRDKTQGMVVPFVTARAIQSRLDEIVGPNGWKPEYQPWKGETAQLCGISIYDPERDEWIEKWDGSPDTDIEPIKGGLSQSFKRAATVWGIGRYLYKVEGVWVDIEPCGKSYRIKRGCIPPLPAWALPDGAKNTLPNEAPQNRPAQQNHGRPAQDDTPHLAPLPENRTRRLTDKQVNRAYVKGKAGGMSESDVLSMAMNSYGVDDIALLTREQYDEFCGYLDTFSN